MSEQKPPEIEILPGNPGEPLFKTEDERRRFEEEYAAEAKKKLDKLPRSIRLWPIPRY